MTPQIINRMIERLDEPLNTTEASIKRINAKLSLPNQQVAPPVAKNAATQVIYDTVAKAERLHTALLTIEEELMNRKWAEQNKSIAPRQLRMEDMPETPGLPYMGTVCCRIIFSVY